MEVQPCGWKRADSTRRPLLFGRDPAKLTEGWPGSWLMEMACGVCLDSAGAGQGKRDLITKHWRHKKELETGLCNYKRRGSITPNHDPN